MKNILKTVTLKSKALALKTALNLSLTLSDKNLERIMYVMEKLSTDPVYKGVCKNIRERVKKNDPFIQLLKKMKELSPASRKGIMNNLGLNAFILGNETRREIVKKEGWQPPFLLTIDVTDRCNLQCPGCWAGTYGKSNPDMSFELLDRIMKESKELGMYFVVILGGEPFIRQDLLKLFEKHNDMYFMVYTNGTCITPEIAKKLGEQGNSAIAISIEGFEKETDARRGKGTYKKLIDLMALLKKEGVFFGFSSMATNKNADIISSEEFINFCIDKGCMFGWYFQYIPTGRSPDVKLMTTPEKRNEMRIRINKIRNEKPIFLADFWNDGHYVGGCMAGAKTYLHITNKGEVESCVFAHFAVDNITNKSLKEAMNSEFFKAIRKVQPYSANKNLLAPCMIIDHPQVLRGLCKQYNAHATQPGGDALIKDPKTTKFINDYAKKWLAITDPVWDNDPEYQKWKAHWFKERSTNAWVKK